MNGRGGGANEAYVMEPSVRPRTTSTPGDMVWIEGGTFRMGSDRHYPEEAPSHRVAVTGSGSTAHR